MIILLNPLYSYISSFERKLLFSGIIFIAFGCSKSPEETVSKYLDHTFVNFNGKKAYKLLSSEDRIFITESEFTSEIKRKNIFNEKLLSKHKSQYSYKILQTIYLNKDTLIVKVRLEKPNFHRILHQMIPFAKASSIYQLNETSKNKYSLQKQYKEILEGEQMQIEQEEQEYTLIREKQEYKILLNFKFTKDKLSMRNWLK